MMIIWVGASAVPALLQDVFGVDDIHQIDIRSVRIPSNLQSFQPPSNHLTISQNLSQPNILPNLPTTISSQIHNILAARRHDRHGVDKKLFVARQNMDAMEIEFSDMLVEDQNNGAMSYIDCTFQFHCPRLNVS